MTGYEQMYLTMVAVGFVAFAVTLMSQQLRNVST